MDDAHKQQRSRRRSILMLRLVRNLGGVAVVVLASTSAAIRYESTSLAGPLLLVGCGLAMLVSVLALVLRLPAGLKQKQAAEGRLGLFAVSVLLLAGYTLVSYLYYARDELQLLTAILAGLSLFLSFHADQLLRKL